MDRTGYEKAAARPPEKAKRQTREDRQTQGEWRDITADEKTDADGLSINQRRQEDGAERLE
jgi:hypothetical protein